MAAILEAKEVSKKYRLGELDVTALRGINLEVFSGDFLAIAGTSGSGKTTLLNLLGVIDRPTDGRIFVEGVDTAGMSSRNLSHLRAAKIGFVFQTFNLLPVLSAAENVEYPLLIAETPAKERKEKVMQALDKVGLSKFAAHRPAQLSGGQRQRVAVARAIVKHPAVVLADEPTANLDKKTALGILDLMHDLNLREGMTFVFSSHDPLILGRASRMIYLSDGEQTEPPEGGLIAH